MNHQGDDEFILQNARMKHWQRDLGYIRLVGPDEPRFDQAVKRIDEYIERLEEAVQLLALDGLVDPQRVVSQTDEGIPGSGQVGC